MSNPLLLQKILLVEDEPHLRSTLEILLSPLTNQLDTATTLAEARKAVSDCNYDLILLDRTLPDGDGATLCVELRRALNPTFICILSARGTVDDRVHGLNVGADDYLPKPFAWPELEARIKALSRRTPREAVRVWEQDEGLLRIRGPDGWVQLTPLEYKLVTTLMRARGKIVTRDELLREVWGFSLLPKTRTVDQFLARVRRLFEPNPEFPQHFLTVRGAGYRFIAAPTSEHQKG
jgi:two-component system alkaline phosphatase synthesis response regulator PhoP